MLRKKLLTIACVVGILACGACFLPPGDNGPSYPPPPPSIRPVRPELQEITAIRIVVEDATTTHFLDPSAVAQGISKNLLEQASHSHINLEKSETLQPGEAVLRIKLENTTAIPHNPSQGGRVWGWTFRLKFTATLSNSNGQTILDWKDRQYNFMHTFQTGYPANVWGAPEIQDRFSSAFGFYAVFEMLYGK